MQRVRGVTAAWRFHQSGRGIFPIESLSGDTLTEGTLTMNDATTKSTCNSTNTSGKGCATASFDVRDAGCVTSKRTKRLFIAFAAVSIAAVVMVFVNN